VPHLLTRKGSIAKPNIFLFTSSSDDEFVAANDLEGLQKLFSQYCDDEGLMSKNSIQRIPSILQLLVRCNSELLPTSCVCVFDEKNAFYYSAKSCWTYDRFLRYRSCFCASRMHT
jgi:hypothetical protein